MVINLSPGSAIKMIRDNAKNPDFIIIDVRTEAEKTDAYIDGSVLVDVNSSEFNVKIDQLDRGKIYLVYCRSGNRSMVAAKAMGDMGFTKIFNLEGGLLSWQDENHPIKSN